MKLLDVRVFDEATKKSVYAKQTEASEANSTSNCPLCAVGHAVSKSKIWRFAEMDADPEVSPHLEGRCCTRASSLSGERRNCLPWYELMKIAWRCIENPSSQGQHRNLGAR